MPTLHQHILTPQTRNQIQQDSLPQHGLQEVKDCLCLILSPQDQTTLRDHAKLIESFLQDLKAEKINTLLLDADDYKLPLLTRLDSRIEEAYQKFLASQRDFPLKYQKLLRLVKGVPGIESRLKAEIEDVLVDYGVPENRYKNFKVTLNLSSEDAFKDFATKIQGRTKLKLIVPNHLPQGGEQLFSNISHIKSLEIQPKSLHLGDMNELAGIFAYTHNLRVLGVTGMNWENIPLEDITSISSSGTLRHLELCKTPIHLLEKEKIRKIFSGGHKVHTLGLGSDVGIESMIGENLLEFFSQFPNLIRIGIYGNFSLPNIFSLFQSKKSELQSVLKNVHILSCSGDFGFFNIQELADFACCFPNLKKIVGIPESKAKKIYAERAVINRML